MHTHSAPKGAKHVIKNVIRVEVIGAYKEDISFTTQGKAREGEVLSVYRFID
jgi:hypothetical protein